MILRPKARFEGGELLCQEESRCDAYVPYILVLSLLVPFSRQIISEAQSTSQPSNAVASHAKPKQNQPNCTNNGTYVNSKGQTVPRPENCSAASKRHRYTWSVLDFSDLNATHLQCNFPNCFSCGQCLQPEDGQSGGSLGRLRWVVVARP